MALMVRLMEEQPEFDLDAIRSEIPLLRTTVPMHHCSHAPQTASTRAAAERYLTSWNERGMDWEAWIGEVELARSTFARLIGADADEVGVFTSVSQAVTSLASALRFESPRNVIVLTEAEFPTVAHIWSMQQGQGARLRWVEVKNGTVGAGSVADAVRDDTLVVSITHGYYQTGALLDLASAREAAREHGALFFVDAYQTLGTRTLDVKELGIDVLASGTLKYLMGIPGIAFLYVRRELAERLEPTATGWFGRRDPFAFETRVVDWADGARRFDTGTPPVLAAYVARAGMEMIEATGLEAVGRWNRTLSGHLIRGGLDRGLELLGPVDPDRRTPSTAFAVSHSSTVEAAMRARGVLSSARGPAIRLAPHFINTLAEVDQALDTLVEVLAEMDRR